MLIRSANALDIDAMRVMAEAVPAGMTSMPNDQVAWENRLFHAENSFSTESKHSPKRFFLVLTDGDHILGTAGIDTKVGFDRPFYNYKVSTQVMASKELDLATRYQTLNLVNDFTGATELNSLFLLPSARRKYLGQFLSRSRFLLMYDFIAFFDEQVFAEIRGWLDADNHSPFWDHIGKQFFNMPYQRADFLSAVSGSQFISDLMPKHPIYLNLLPESVRNVVGLADDLAVPATALLKKEGFRYQGYVDIFDAGPVLQAALEQIESIKIAKQTQVKPLNQLKAEKSLLCIVSNRDGNNYRQALCPVYLHQGEYYLDSAFIEQLQLNSLHQISFLPINGA